ncbi:MAG TPA: LysR substrate-binding domain-containing protein, partial [Acetobacteraceae bacterium]|nr:LysR substrate-binding domain-containing protein [Acetobacteraceae bacterium]
LGVERRIALVIPHFAASPGVVAASDLAVTVPSHLGEVYANSGVVTVPLPFETPRIEVALYWHERLHEDPASRWLRGMFVSLFARPASHT